MHALEFDLSSYLKSKVTKINHTLDQLLPSDGSYLGPVGEVMRYCLFPGGKRFRPVLTLAACEAIGSPDEVALPVACAFEMIHCFSLVHDDLPCMDDDDYRRGKPTCHKQYNEALALLAGDGLAIWAFRITATASDSIPADKTLQLIIELAEASGHPGMVGGQVLDLLAQNTPQISPDDILTIHKSKTGALIRGAARAGAIAAGATPEQLQAITSYAENVGLVFQITDDILDLGEDPDSISFPAIFGLERSKQMAAQAVQDAVDFIKPLGPNAQPLKALAQYLLTRTT